MTYRDDLDALAARQATLQAELGRKQRELAEVSGMLDEARQAREAARDLERTPDLLRRARLHLLAGALAVTLGSGAALGAVVAVDEGAPSATPAERRVRVRVRPALSAEAGVRLKAEVEALRALGLIPVVAPTQREVMAKLAPEPPAWILGSTVPARGSLWKPQARPAAAPGSAAREHER